MFSLATTYSLIFAMMNGGKITGMQVVGVYNSAVECSQAQSRYPHQKGTQVFCCRSDDQNCGYRFTFTN